MGIWEQLLWVMKVFVQYFTIIDQNWTTYVYVDVVIN